MASAFEASRSRSTHAVNQAADLKRQLPPSKPSSVDLPALLRATQVLQEQFAKDAQIIPDPGDLLTSPGNQASASYSMFRDDTRVPFQKRKFVGIPEGLFQYYESASVSSHMGLLPEIERAWVSIDHKLFLWDYIEGQEMSSFVDQPDVITHVAVVKPREGVFVDEITSLLVICTPVSVLLIGYSFAPTSTRRDRPQKEVKLYATDMTIKTDVEMTSVVGTRDGRIFMCGAQDGNLYELHYQEKESWFGKRVQIINHSGGGVQSLLPVFVTSSQEDRIVSLIADPSRDCFYTLTAKNSISLYKPTTEKSVQHIHTLSNLYKAAQDKAPGSPALTPQNFQIISLHVINPSESHSGVQLLAVTVNGVRLYFGPSSSFSYGYSSGPGPSSSLRPIQLVHVRLPPANLSHPDHQPAPHLTSISNYPGAQPAQPTSRPFVVTALDNSSYANGMLIAAQPGDTDGGDFLLCMAPDLTRIGSLGQLNLAQAPSQQQPTQYNYNSPPGVSRPPLTEYATLLAIPGRTWAMASVAGPTTAPSTTVSVPIPINELAYQFIEPPQQFMLLTNVGLTYLAKRRAIDYLKAALEEFQSEGTAQPIIEFRDSFGRDQTCAMLLALASGNTYLNFTDGAPDTISMASPDIVAVAKQAFYDFGERPMWSERVTYGTTDTQGTAIFSGRRQGLAMYFSRLVRPLWKSKLTKPGLRELAVSDSTLVTIQKNLYALREFLDSNPHLFHSIPTESNSSRPNATEQEAWRAEQQSVSELFALLGRTIEALSFVLLLNDYRFGDLITHCEANVQNILATQTFEELITSQAGMVTSRALVNVVIDQQIGQQISVDTISEVLQQRCGSFCSADDVMLYKAKENIRKAVETRNPGERQNCLSESLRLFSKGARILEFDQLREIVGDYQQLHYAKGAIDLPLTCAQYMDSDNSGLEYWHAGCPPNDHRSASYEKRLQCYDLAMDSLATFEDRCSTSTPETKESMEVVRSHAYELAFASEDEMFHSTLYDWLIGRKLADDLLEMRPTFLEAHLRREPVTAQKYQLLWQFYVKNGQPLRAAEVLGALAESTQFDLHLDTRLEYLTLAVANAKSHPISVGGRHETAIAFLTDLEEKLEVAQVQFEIYNTLAPLVEPETEAGRAVQLLVKRLFTMSELYQDYAVPFDQPVLKLVCLHVSEHRDETVVRPIWNQIFQQIIEEHPDPSHAADALLSKVVPLGRRFYPSDSAFPFRYIATLLVRFTLANKGTLASGWAPRLLLQCGIPFVEVWDVFHEMYESQVPPFNDQLNVQAISSDIAILLHDWLESVRKPGPSLGSRSEFPVGRLDIAIDQYLAELEPGHSETRKMYEDIKRQLRRNW